MPDTWIARLFGDDDGGLLGEQGCGLKTIEEQKNCNEKSK